MQTSYLTGVDVVISEGPETDGINKIKLKLRYKLGGFKTFIWSILG